MEERYGGHTWMWRSCCLDKVVEAFQMKEYKGSKIVVTKYNWCMTRDIGNITIAGRKRSMIRKGGLMYSQFYATSDETPKTQDNSLTIMNPIKYFMGIQNSGLQCLLCMVCGKRVKGSFKISQADNS